MNWSSSMIFFFVGIVTFSIISCSKFTKLKNSKSDLNYEINNIMVENLKINEGSVIDFIIEVQNLSQTPLQIGGVKSSCGCLIPEWYNRKIQKNEKSRIILKYYSKSKGSKEGNEHTYTVWINFNGKEDLVEIKTKVFSD